MQIWANICQQRASQLKSRIKNWIFCIIGKFLDIFAYTCVFFCVHHFFLYFPERGVLNLCLLLTQEHVVQWSNGQDPTMLCTFVAGTPCQFKKTCFHGYHVHAFPPKVTIRWVELYFLPLFPWVVFFVFPSALILTTPLQP